MPRERAQGIVADICGLHAQLAASAELSLWARVENLEPGAVDRAPRTRSLVKTWAMRGTLHLLPADELALWVGAQGALPPRWEKPSWRRGFGVTEDEVRGILAAVPKALAGEPLTREPEGVVRLLPAFDPHVVAAPRDADAVPPAELRGRVHRPQGRLSPVLLVDGRFAGVWRHERVREALLVEIEPFADVGDEVFSAAEHEAQRLASFLGGELELRWSTT